MKQLVDNALVGNEEIMTNVVGKTDKLLHRYTTLNATLDELMHRGACLATNTDIYFSNGWRYGAPIAKGEITENELYNMAPMNPPISVVDLTGKEIKEMMEENLTRTFGCNRMKQMGGYAKRVFGIHLNVRIENPDGGKIQELIYKGNHLEMNKVYEVSFITVQGVPAKYGKNRKQTDCELIDSIKLYLKKNGAFTPSKNKNYRLV